MSDFKKYNLESLLKFIERNIDPDHLEDVENKHIKSLSKNKVTTSPLTIIPEIDENLFFPYQEAFNDPSKMMYNELLKTCGGSIYSSVKIKDHFPFHIRSNHGIGIIPSLFGLNHKTVNDNMPWVEHLSNRKEIKEIVSKGIPRLKNGLGKKVIESHQFYLEKLTKYPKCSDAIKISQPDLQGPFDIAHLMIGTDIFYMVYENPKLLHELLTLITKTYERFREYIDDFINDKAKNNMMYVHGGIYPGNIIIKDDTAVTTLSPEMYREFSWRYNKKLFKTFSGSWHSCGKLNEWVYDIIDTDHLLAIHFGNPEMQDTEEVLNVKRKLDMAIVNWGYNQEYSFLKNVIESDIDSGMTLACQAENITSGKEIISEHCFS